MNQNSEKYIQWCLKRVEFLQQNGVIPVMIFDGNKLPQKQEIEQKRENNRNENKIKAFSLYQQGRKDEAQKIFASSIDVTPEMANKLLQALKSRKIECIVAPYEADAQLAYLSKIGYVHVIITEDSDLLAFGASCIFYKMDNTGNGKEIKISNLGQCQDFNFTQWNQNMFLTACILSGCDYLNQINKIGIKTAFKLVQENKNFKKTILQLKQNNKYQVPQFYEENFRKAFLTFRYQTVYCPFDKKTKMLSQKYLDQYKQRNQLNNENFDYAIVDEHDSQEDDFMEFLQNCEDLSFLGNHLTDQEAQSVANGDLNPINLQFFEQNTSINSFNTTQNIQDCNDFNNLADQQSNIDKNKSNDDKQKQIQLKNNQSQITLFGKLKPEISKYNVIKQKNISSKYADKQQSKISSFFQTNKSQQGIIQDNINDIDELINIPNKKIKKISFL